MFLRTCACICTILLAATPVANTQTVVSSAKDGSPTIQGAHAQGSMSSGNALAAPVTIDLKNVPFEIAVKEIARRSGAQVMYSQAVVALDRTVSVRGSNITLAAALRQILEGTNAEARLSPGGQVIIAKVAGGTSSRNGQGIVSGRVTDAKTRKGIPGATVSIGNDARGATTGDNGLYRLSGVAAGVHTVTARLVGYARQSRSITVGEGATVAVDFQMEPSASVLDQVVVTGTIVATELKAVPNAITVISAKQIEERGITKIDQLFRGTVPGLFAQNNTTNGLLLDEVTMFSRGATSLPTQFSSEPSTNPIKTYVDGVEMADSKFLSQIDPRSIERIEILTGPQASTIYGSNAINGVMQIFTKRGLSSRPQISLDAIAGFVENNFTDHLAPNHSTSARISGTDGHLSYNTGGSWDYAGAWTPTKQTQRMSGYGSGKLQRGPLNVDGSFRRGLTITRRRGNRYQPLMEGAATGEYCRILPCVSTLLMDLSSPFNIKLYGQTLGLTLGYSPLQWWSHELVLGGDMSNTESLALAPSNFRVTDTTLSLSWTDNSRLSQRYTTTIKVPVASFTQMTFTLGADHWTTRASSRSAASTALTGSLGNPVVTRNRPGKNSGGFLQGQFGVKEALFFTYGLRAEWNPNYGKDAQPNLAPRYGVAYSHEIGALSAKLRGSYGRSTRPPTESQKLGKKNNWLSGGGGCGQSGTSNFAVSEYGIYDCIRSNPDLGPETQRGSEGGLELYFGNRGSLVVTRYNQTVDNLINNPVVDSVRSVLPEAVLNCGSSRLRSDGYCYAEVVQNLNIGNLRNQGWELQGSANLGPFTTRGTYSWTKSRIIGVTPKYKQYFTYLVPGAPFDYMPEHTWALNLAYSKSATTVALNWDGVGFLYRNWDALADAIFYRRLDYTKPRLNRPSSYKSIGKGYAIANLNASHRFSSKVEALLQVDNLGDYYRNDYASRQPTMGRQSKAGFRMRW